MEQRWLPQRRRQLPRRGLVVVVWRLLFWGLWIGLVGFQRRWRLGAWLRGRRCRGRRVLPPLPWGEVHTRGRHPVPLRLPRLQVWPCGLHELQTLSGASILGFSAVQVAKEQHLLCVSSRRAYRLQRRAVGFYIDVFRSGR
mmetsp:Transcript_86664/g.250278  ORF Transcript_86664/g.250278 Transcript_86664/m.250278 type:complete len:141 (-) Transcript_86664:42-464(-)